MTAKTSRLACLLPGLAALALLSALPTAANATACGKGRIVMLQLSSGGSSDLRIVTSINPASNWQQILANGQWATQIWYENNTRWTDRLKLLTTAFALGQTVEISSSDPNCMGPSDEFTINVSAP